MPSQRLVYRYSDGMNEWRDPAIRPSVGTVIWRGSLAWVVTSVEQTNDLITVTLQRLNEKRAASLAE